MISFDQIGPISLKPIQGPRLGAAWSPPAATRERAGREVSANLGATGLSTVVRLCCRLLLSRPLSPDASPAAGWRASGLFRTLALSDAR